MTRWTRRRALGALALAPIAAGCTGVLYGRGTERGAPYVGDGPPMLRIAVFESSAMRKPIHTGVLIHAPEGHVLYDPAGWWDDGQGQRVGDVTYGMTPAREAAYLSRDAFGRDAGTWIVHVFETEVPPEVARRAVEIAETRDMAVIGLCVHAVSTLLAQLPGFEGLRGCLLPRRLLEQLLRREDLSYTRMRVPAETASVDA